MAPRSYLALLPTLVAIGLACSSSDDAPEKDVTQYACRADTHAVGSACVPNVFDQALIPSKARLAQIDTDTDGVRHVRASLLVSMKDPAMSLDAAKAIAARYNGEVIGAIPFAGFYQLSFSDTPDATSLAAKASTLASDPAVAGAARDVLIPSTTLEVLRPATTDFEKITAATTFDEFHGYGADQPVGANGKAPLDRIGLTAAWNAIYAANPPLRPVTVGILDGMVNHKWFPQLSFSGANDLRVFATESPDSVQANHGTSVASLIGAPNDGSGTTGILGAMSCVKYDLAPMAILEDSMGAVLPPPRGNDLRVDALFYGMVFAVQAGARVVNASIGTSYLTGDQRFNFARNVRLVTSAAPDTLFVFAAGNDGLDAAFAHPCSAARLDEETKSPNVMCIAATGADDDNDAVWYHPTMKTMKIGSTNKDVRVKTVSLAAPGDRLLAQLANGKLTMFGGTSGAAPLVSGTAGLLFAILPGLDGETAKRILVDSGDPIDEKLSGKRLNIASAVKRALDLANRLRPEMTGQGECRPPDDGDGGGATPKGVCVAPDPSHLQCWWDTDTECNFTTTTKEGVERSGTCNGNVRFPWNDDASINEFTLEIFDAQIRGVFLTTLPKPGVTFTVTGGRTSNSLNVHIESTTTPLGVIGDALGGGDKISSLDATLQWTPAIITGDWSVTAATGAKAKGTFKGTYHPPP